MYNLVQCFTAIRLLRISDSYVQEYLDDLGVPEFSGQHIFQTFPEDAVNT